VPRRGDVIVFHAPSGNGEDFIKRVVALPGEEVEIHDGTVFVNGRPLAEPWSPRRDHSAFPAYQVTSGHVFVLGDNRADSNDSRTWGEALATDRIVGRAWLSVWPLDRLGLIRSDGIRTVAAEGPSR
jgi:signal peptidase I